MKRNKIFGIIFLFIVMMVGLTAVQTISPRPPAILNGYVLDATTGDPIYGAIVDLWVYDFITGWIYIGQDETDSNGHYSFEGFPIGAKKVRISKSGYHTYEGVFEVTIYLETYTYDYHFYGHIRNSVTEQELSDAFIEITCGTKTISYTTDNSGYYCIVFQYSTSGVRTFEVEVSKSGYDTYTTTITRNYGYEQRHYYLNEIRTWMYCYDDGYIATGDGTRTQFIVTESLLSDGSWQVTYDVKLDVFYDMTWAHNFQVHRYNPYGNIWYRSWITTDDATIIDLDGDGPGERYHAYIYTTQTYNYSSSYTGYAVGIQGGILSLGSAGNLALKYGGVLKFWLGNTNYGNEIEYTQWYDTGGAIYGFYGAYDSWMTSHSHPQGAWFRVMNDCSLLG